MKELNYYDTKWSKMWKDWKENDDLLSKNKIVIDTERAITTEWVKEKDKYYTYNTTIMTNTTTSTSIETKPSGKSYSESAYQSQPDILPAEDLYHPYRPKYSSETKTRTERMINNSGSESDSEIIKKIKDNLSELIVSSKIKNDSLKNLKKEIEILKDENKKLKHVIEQFEKNPDEYLKRKTVDPYNEENWDDDDNSVNPKSIRSLSMNSALLTTSPSVDKFIMDDVDWDTGTGIFD